MRLPILPTLLACVMAACASGTPPLAMTPQRLPPPHLLSTTEFPATLPTPASATGPDLLASYTTAARLYHTLRARFISLGEWASSTPPQPTPPQPAPPHP